jgi:hypothetical protein
MNHNDMFDDLDELKAEFMAIPNEVKKLGWTVMYPTIPLAILVVGVFYAVFHG